VKDRRVHAHISDFGRLAQNHLYPCGGLRWANFRRGVLLLDPMHVGGRPFGESAAEDTTRCPVYCYPMTLHVDIETHIQGEHE
jgi:hypothetical protein